MILTSPDLELLRTRPSTTNLNLFIFQPRSVMKCRVNDASIAKGAREIVYNAVSLGSYLDVEANMTMLVGTSAGASDVGRIRIRSADGSQFVVSENSNIEWSNALHLTVLRYWEIWPIFPRIIPDPAVTDNVIFYKDYDIAYTNQNTILGTFVNAGPHRPVLIENGTGTVYYSSNGIYNVLGDALSFNWAFEGGTPTGSVSNTPGNVAYTVPGDYVTRIIVTSASGAVDTTYRYVSVKNKIGEGSTTPTIRWEMTNLAGSRGEAGYSAEFTVFDNITIDENAVVMLLADDWYGGTHQSLGGNFPNAEKIFFVGYIDKGSLKYNYRESSYSFTASSITALMKKASGFSVSVETSAAPDTWFKLLNLDCRRAIYHYLRWHSTVLNTTDFEFNGTDYPIQYFDADRTSLFDSIDSFLRGTLVGTMSSDRQGRLYAEVEPMAYSDPTGSFTPVMEITNRDWMGQPEIEEKHGDTVSYVEYGGVAYSGTSGTFLALLADAPGGVPAFRGDVEKNSGLALADQTQLNALTGNIYANKNSRYPSISLDMAIPPRNLDIAPYETVQVIVNSGDTVRGIALNKLYIPDTASWQYDPKNQILLSSITFLNLVNGQPGETITIPDAPPEDGFDQPGIDIPNIPIFTPVPISNSPTYTWVIKMPGVGGIPGPRLPQDHTALRVDAYCVGGTSVTFNIEICSSAGGGGTDILAADAVATTTAGTAVPAVSAIPLGSWLWLDISSVSGAVSEFVVTLATSG